MDAMKLLLILAGCVAMAGCSLVDESGLKRTAMDACMKAGGIPIWQGDGTIDCRILQRYHDPIEGPVGPQGLQGVR